MYFSKIIFAAVCCFLFTCTSFAQLTYARLSVQYDSSWVCSNLKLVPIKFKDTATGIKNNFKEGFISFSQAMQEGKVTVKEMGTPGGEDVGMLTIKNNTKKNIIIQDGELLAGGKQDRAFASTTIIPPGDGENFLPVFCVEKGRWDRKVRSFRYAGRADAALRRQINVAKKQNKVWKEIDKQLEEKGKINTTGAYLDMYRDTAFADSACLAFFRKKLMDSDSLFAGFIAITGNRIINCELFGSSGLCIAAFETLVKSNLRSVEDKTATPGVADAAVKKFTDNFMQSETQQRRYLAGHGSIYTHEKEVMHIVAYPE